MIKTLLSRPIVLWNNMINTTYRWSMDIASKSYALVALSIISFIESSVFPIPPDIFLIPIVLANRKKAWVVAAFCTISSVMGGFLGYGIGMFLYDIVAVPVLDFYGYLEKFQHFMQMYNEWGAWIVGGAGLTPFPYKVITIASGVAGLDPVIFGISSLLSRGIRFFAISALLWKFGEPVREFIEKNLGWLATLFFVLLLGGFVALKFLI